MPLFRRIEGSSKKNQKEEFQRLPGTKAWLYGQSIVSTGCSDINKACSSGLPLGSIFVLSEEVGIRQGKTIEKLFIAEGINSSQRVLLISTKRKEFIERFTSKLPTVRAIDTTDEATVRQSLKSTGQYGKYLSRYQNKQQMEFCHSFDLSQYETKKEILENLCYLSLYSDMQSEVSAVETRIISSIVLFMTYCKQNGLVGRIVMEIEDFYLEHKEAQIELYKRLRVAIRDSTCLLMTLHSCLCSNAVLCYADCILSIQPWKDITPPDEFKDTSGLLQIIRLPSIYTLFMRNSSIYVYGIKRSMHSLRLSELHIPPLGCKEYSGNDDLF